MVIVTLRLTWALLAGSLATLLCACGLPSVGPSPTGAPPAPGQLVWAAPDNPLTLTVNAGLKPEPKETLIFHVHAHLDVFIDGQPVMVPSGIGINVNDPAVQHGTWNGQPTYGGIAGCSQPCISPLHTHDVSGVIHTESATSTPNKLGEFFTEWGVTLNNSCVGQYCAPATPIAVYVNGARYTGNLADIELSSRKEIAVVIGSAPARIPDSFPSWAPG
ncbi:MAG TPA: hypothetical protein VGJ79_08295 [Candidatus Dormibacteraeota bacterium]|jgi:hypothetical protein